MNRYRTIVADPPWPYEDGFNGWGKRRELPYDAMTMADIASLPVPEIAAAGCHLYLWTTNRYLPDAYSIVQMWGFSYSSTLVWCKPKGQKGLGGRFSITTEFVVHACAPSEAAPPRRVERAGRLIRAAREEAGLTRAEVFFRVRGSKLTGLVSNWESDICLPSEADWRKLQELLPSLAAVSRPVVPSPAPKERPPVVRESSSWWEWPQGQHSAKPDAFLDIVERVSPGPYAELFSRRARFGWDYPIGDQALGGIAA